MAEFRLWLLEVLWQEMASSVDRVAMVTKFMYLTYVPGGSSKRDKF
jgi:hypothetical protein